MPQQDDVEVIREAFSRWNERDIEYWIRHAHPDVEIWSKYAALDEVGRPYRGHAEMRDGALARMYFYSSHAEARDAVGLPE